MNVLIVAEQAQGRLRKATLHAVTAGREVAKLSSQTFFRDLRPAEIPPAPPGSLGDKLDDETREKLERLRRGE